MFHDSLLGLAQSCPAVLQVLQDGCLVAFPTDTDLHARIAAVIMKALPRHRVFTEPECDSLLAEFVADPLSPASVREWLLAHDHINRSRSGTFFEVNRDLHS